MPAVGPALTDEDISLFWRQGFLHISRITSPDDLALIQQLIDPWFEQFHLLSNRRAVDLGDRKVAEGEPQIPEINRLCR